MGSEFNRLYKIFKERNPIFNGSVSLIGHSLGSLIVFDILSNQQQQVDTTLSASHISTLLNESTSIEKFLTDLGLAEYINVLKNEKIDLTSMVIKLFIFLFCMFLCL